MVSDNLKMSCIVVQALCTHFLFMGRHKKVGIIHPVTGVTIYNDGTCSCGFNYLNGYKIYWHGSKCHMLHRHVAELFVANPNKKPIVNHKDGKKYNARSSNLEWVTHSENTLHAYRTGLIPKDYRKFTDKQILFIRRTKIHFRQLAKKYKVSEGVIQRIIKRQTYKNVQNESKDIITDNNQEVSY